MGTLAELKYGVSTFGRNLGFAALNTLGFETTRVARELNSERRKVRLAGLLDASPYLLLLAGTLFKVGSPADRAGIVMLTFAIKAFLAHSATFEFGSGRR
jgi:hypothetical protein